MIWSPILLVNLTKMKSPSSTARILAKVSLVIFCIRICIEIALCLVWIIYVIIIVGAGAAAAATAGSQKPRA